MSSRVNVNDTVEEAFGFTIGGLDYDFKYPTLRAMEPIQELSRERDKVSKEDTPESVDKLAQLDNKLTEKFYEFVIPVGHNTPIKETLDNQPLPVVKAFNKLIIEQLSAE